MGISRMLWHPTIPGGIGRRSNEEANDQEAPADSEDAEAKSGKPEPEEREAGRLAPVRIQARSLTTLLGCGLTMLRSRAPQSSNASRFSSK